MRDNEGGIVAARVSVAEALVSARRGRSNSRRTERTRKFALDNMWHVALVVFVLCFLDNLRWVVQRSAVMGCGCIRRLQSAWHRTRPRLAGGCHSSWCPEPSSSRRLVSVQHAWDMYELPFLCAFSGCRKLPPVLGPHSTLAHTPTSALILDSVDYWLLRTREQCWFSSQTRRGRFGSGFPRRRLSPVPIMPQSLQDPEPQCMRLRPISPPGRTIHVNFFPAFGSPKEISPLSSRRAC